MVENTILCFLNHTQHEKVQLEFHLYISHFKCWAIQKWIKKNQGFVSGNSLYLTQLKAIWEINSIENGAIYKSKRCLQAICKQENPPPCQTYGLTVIWNMGAVAIGYPSQTHLKLKLHELARTSMYIYTFCNLYNNSVCQKFKYAFRTDIIYCKSPPPPPWF